MRVKRQRGTYYTLLLTLWLLISGASTVFANMQTTSLSTLPTAPVLFTDAPPSYQFQSTSAYPPTTNTTVYEPGAESPSGVARAARRGDIWDSPPTDQEEIGQVYTPVGDPDILLILLLLSGYVIGRIGWRRIKSKTSGQASGGPVDSRHETK